MNYPARRTWSTSTIPTARWFATRRSAACRGTRTSRVGSPAVITKEACLFGTPSSAPSCRRSRSTRSGAGASTSITLTPSWLPVAVTTARSSCGLRTWATLSSLLRARPTFAASSSVLPQSMLEFCSSTFVFFFTIIIMILIIIAMIIMSRLLT